MPRRSQSIPVARPWMDGREARAARRAILSGWVTQGPEVGAFEREFAAAVGAKYACAVSSCTVALHLALKVVGVANLDQLLDRVGCGLDVHISIIPEHPFHGKTFSS